MEAGMAVVVETVSWSFTRRLVSSRQLVSLAAVFPFGASTKGRRWQGRGTAFKGKKSQLRCTLLGYWSEEHQDSWLVLTDLAPECADACWYGLRDWIEQGFKHSKRNGWQWQHAYG